MSDSEDEPIYFEYSACLRIHGESLDFEALENAIGIIPTHCHRRGDKKGLTSPGYRDDAWHLDSSLPASKHLDRHLEELWHKIAHAADFLRELKGTAKIDVFCGYRSNCDHCGVDIAPSSMKILVELELTCSLSIIIA